MDGEDGTFPVLLKTLSDPSDDVGGFSINSHITPSIVCLTSHFS